MITDTAFYRYSHYHDKTDTYEKLNYHNMAFLSEGLKYAILEIVQGIPPPTSSVVFSNGVNKN